jgi:putative transcriptional regulator
MQSINLTDHFLIAMPSMADPYFAKSLVYIAEHNEQGALGLVVNRPLELNLATLLERISISFAPEDMAYLCGQPVFFGGPVQTDRGFVLHRPHGQWQSTLIVNAEIGLTSSRDILQSVASRLQPPEMLVTLGYSGWGAGQLEHELGQNAWLTVPASAHILFGLPHEERLASALEMLGVDFARLSDAAGHA